MRYYAAIILSLILLTGCSTGSVYKSKGVSYPGQPAKELEACYRFINPPVQGAEISTLPVTGTPLSLGNRIYLPVETNFLNGKTRSAYTTVYALNADTQTVTDSLVLKEEGVKLSYRHLVFDKDLYLVGTRDTLLHIIKLDENLKVKEEYNPGLRFVYLASVAVYDGRLRVVGSSLENDIVLYDIKTDTMQPERNRLLLRDFDHYDVEGDKLWYFLAEDSTLTTARLDLSVFAPTPEFRTFTLQIPKLQDYRVYNVKAAGNTIYLSWNWFTDDAQGASKLVAIDYENGNQKSKEIAGRLSFDVISRNGKTYLFSNAQHNKSELFSLAELKSDLTQSEPLVSFFLAQYQSVRNLFPWGDNKLFLTGFFQQKTGKKIVQEVPGMKKVKLDEAYPQPFLAVFEL
jgi:hypothetical protein